MKKASYRQHLANCKKAGVKPLTYAKWLDVVVLVVKSL